MNTRFARKPSVFLAALLIGTVSGSIALCQPPGGFGGPGGPGGPGRRPMGGRQLSPNQAPLSALTAGLQLTDAQKTQIQSIQNGLKQLRESIMPRPGQGNEPPPDRETMRANMERLRAAEQKANREITALLTATQKSKLPALLKQLEGIGALGIPLQVYDELELTAAQKTQLNAIAKRMRDTMPRPGEGGERGQGNPPPPREEMERNRQQFHEEAMAVLTDAQKTTVQEFIEAHPRPPFGGGRPGGHGGPGGDGDGPPPPPPGGFGENPPAPPAN